MGSIVHFVLIEGKCAGSHRPAIVVRHDRGLVCNVQVLTDGNNRKKDINKNGDGLPGKFWRYSVQYDPTGKEPGTWHWPENVEVKGEL